MLRAQSSLPLAQFPRMTELLLRYKIPLLRHCKGYHAHHSKHQSIGSATQLVHHCVTLRTWQLSLEVL